MCVTKAIFRAARWMVSWQGAMHATSICYRFWPITLNHFNQHSKSKLVPPVLLQERGKSPPYFQIQKNKNKATKHCWCCFSSSSTLFQWWMLFILEIRSSCISNRTGLEEGSLRTLLALPHPLLPPDECRGPAGGWSDEAGARFTVWASVSTGIHSGPSMVTENHGWWNLAHWCSQCDWRPAPELFWAPQAAFSEESPEVTRAELWVPSEASGWVESSSMWARGTCIEPDP